VSQNEEPFDPHEFLQNVLPMGHITGERIMNAMISPIRNKNLPYEERVSRYREYLAFMEEVKNWMTPMKQWEKTFQAWIDKPEEEPKPTAVDVPTKSE
jgi:hypothetical protein